MTFEAGTKLGPYEIVQPIGAGGMGQVYKARDARLNRFVAIKVFPEHLSANAELKARFEREAQTLASLSHPHICPVFDVGQQDGTDYLVMEFLEGQTLAERLEKGALPQDEALKIAIEIADALDKAHRQGVIHRDVKPSNVMLTKTGAKLLDFGLAKLKASPVLTTLSEMPTRMSGANASPIGRSHQKNDMTAHGTILGTLQYMSPEQLEGEEADARSDIFAFGAVVYEMLTGRKAFQGKSQSSLIAALMHIDPPAITALQPMTPAAVDRVVKICLAKNPDERWQTVHDLAVQLSWLGESEPQTNVSGRARSSRVWIGVAAVSLLTVIVLSAVLIHDRGSPAQAAAVRFTIASPEKTVFEAGEDPAEASNGGGLSPDGRKLAFTAKDESGKVLLWVRPLDALAARPLPATDGAYLPFWSPDSRSIGFFAQGKLKKIDVDGGPPQTLCNAEVAHGGSWSSEGVILFASTFTQPLRRVSSAGGESAPITNLLPQQTGHRFPSFLPDGRHFLYFVGGAQLGDSAILVGSLDSPEAQRLLASESPAVYAAPGYVLFLRQGTLLAQPFDAKKLKLTGEPVPIAEQVAFDANHLGFSASTNGVLAYRTGDFAAATNFQLTGLDRTGKVIESVGPLGRYLGPDISPDGKRIAVHRHDGTGGDVWLLDASGGKTSRFTFDASQDNSQPTWSPDGGLIVFASLRNGKSGLYLKPSSGVGNEELLLESDSLKMPMSWSADGKFILYWVRDPKTGQDVWALPLAGDRKPFPILQTPFNEQHPQMSPDGRFFSYTSNETGRGEVYVQSFPPGAGKWQISTNGGGFSRWRRDGKELFYLDQPLGKMFSVRINAIGSKFESSSPQPLFDSGYSVPIATHLGGQWNAFAVSADGQRFLIPRSESNLRGSTNAPITIVLNWTAALNKK